MLISTKLNCHIGLPNNIEAPFKTGHCVERINHFVVIDQEGLCVLLAAILKPIDRFNVLIALRLLVEHVPF